MQLRLLVRPVSTVARVGELERQVWRIKKKNEIYCVNNIKLICTRASPLPHSGARVKAMEESSVGRRGQSMEGYEQQIHAEPKTRRPQAGLHSSRRR